MTLTFHLHISKSLVFSPPHKPSSVAVSYNSKKISDLTDWNHLDGLDGQSVFMNSTWTCDLDLWSPYPKINMSLSLCIYIHLWQCHGILSTLSESMPQKPLALAVDLYLTLTYDLGLDLCRSNSKFKRFMPHTISLYLQWFHENLSKLSGCMPLKPSIYMTLTSDLDLWHICYKNQYGSFPSYKWLSVLVSWNLTKFVTTYALEARKLLDARYANISCWFIFDLDLWPWPLSFKFEVQEVHAPYHKPLSAVVSWKSVKAVRLYAPETFHIYDLDQWPWPLTYML